MSGTVEIRVMELLCSRLCHELISPVSAISNGVELMGDDPGEMLDDITALLAQSSTQASRRLQFYRVAYGFGGEAAGAMGLTGAGKLVRGIAEEGNITLSWPEGADALGRISTKALLNAALMAVEALPRGGEITASVHAGPQVDYVLTASGEGAQLWRESIDALDPAVTVDALTPRSVQAYYTRVLAESAGGSLTHDVGQGGSVILSVHLPKEI